MATMFVKHKVLDFENWKKIYDEIDPLRKEKGVIAASVHRDPVDRNTVIITHRFADMETAMSFANSEEIRTAMLKSGVSSAPEVWYAEDVEETKF